MAAPSPDSAIARHDGADSPAVCPHRAAGASIGGSGTKPVRVIAGELGFKLKSPVVGEVKSGSLMIELASNCPLSVFEGGARHS